MATATIISDKNVSHSAFGVIDSKLVLTIKYLDEVLSDASYQRKEAVNKLQDILSKHIEDINSIDDILARLPPTYDELVRLQRERRNKKAISQDDEEIEEANHALNLHLNKISNSTEGDILILPDDLDEEISLDSSSYSVCFDDDNQECATVISNTGAVSRDKANNVRTWKEFEKITLRENFFDQAKELRDVELAMESELNALEDNNSPDVQEKRKHLIRNLERHQINRVKTVKSILYNYNPKLNHHAKPVDQSKSLLKDIIRNIEQEVN